MAINQAALGDMSAAHATLEQLRAIGPDFYRDPAAVYRAHRGTEETIAALIEGLRKAGWTEPNPN